MSCIAYDRPQDNAPCGLSPEEHEFAFVGHRYIAPSTMYCGDCDGVGWVEGGTTIKTTCARCHGDGWEPDR